MSEEGERRSSAPDVWYEAGRQVQAVAIIMRKHHFVPEQQVCACGRLAVTMLPVFGLRCEIASMTWQRACEAIGGLLASGSSGRPSPRPGAHVGRAPVPTRAG